MSYEQIITIDNESQSITISNAGYNYDWLQNVFLSSYGVSFPSLTAIDRHTGLKRVSAICPPFEGFLLPVSAYKAIDRNNLYLNLSSFNLSGAGYIDVIYENIAGYTKLSDINNILLRGIITPFYSLTGNFYAWYDASDSSSITTATSSNGKQYITAWNDKSGKNNTLTSIVLSNPLYNIETQKGLNVASFASRGSIGTTFMNIPEVSQSWFIVCRIDSIFGNAASPLSYMTRLPDNGISSWEIYAYDNDCFIGALGRSIPPPGALILEYGKPRINGGTCLGTDYHLFEVVFNRELQTTTIYLDGTFKDSKPDTLPWNQITGARFRIFTSRSSSQFPIGTVAEVICLSGANDDERQAVEKYLRQKWIT